MRSGVSGSSVLWASNGAARDAECAAAIRQVLLPSLRRLTVLSVAPLDQSPAHRIPPLVDREAELAAAGEAGRRALALLGEVEAETEAKVTWGSASAEIVHEAEAVEADILVLGKSSHGDVHRMLLGETPERVLISSRRPVLLVGENAVQPEDGVAVLFESPRAFPAAVELLESLQLPPGMPVWLLAYIEPVRQPAGMLLTLNQRVRRDREVVHDVRRQVVEEYFHKATAQLTAGGREVRSLVRDGGAVTELKTFVEQNGVGLVVASTGGQAEVASGRAAEVARRMPCCVLVSR